MESPSSNNAKDKNGGWKSLFLWILIAVLLRWQVIEPRWIPSGSMLPTLQIKDRILVEKLRPRIQNYKNRHIDLERVVVFHPPRQLIEAGYDENSALIKRVVGIPGDQIEVHNGELIRNGEVVVETWRNFPMSYEMESISIPIHFLWVLGDNRNNSLDSHLWGFLPEENVIGTAIWRYWPINKFGPIRFPTPQKIES